MSPLYVTNPKAPTALQGHTQTLTQRRAPGGSMSLFIVKLFTRRSPSTARYVFADSVAAAEGYSEQQKQGCSSDELGPFTPVASAPQWCRQQHIVRPGLLGVSAAQPIVQLTKTQVRGRHSRSLIERGL